MKLSTRTRYGIRAAIELAKHYGQGPVQIKVIGEKQAISVKYLEQLMAMLKAGGFIHSVRGSKGGYVLAREPEQIRMDELVLSLEGSISTAECVEDGGFCARAADCAARDLWTRVQEAVLDVLKSVTLKDLVENTKSKHQALSYTI
ncbi:MAG: Rrf2 family transcriptional regulator [Phycisphaerae bacterium]|jgi:Rrf2 family protein